jgi:hypothetical protein
VRVAWVTHHLPGDRGNPSLLSGGFAGGAEMLDWEMVACAPDGVEVSWVPPDEWERASEFDRVVVTGTDLLSQHAMLKLAQLEPVVWVHHEQTPTMARQKLFEAARPFVGMSELHVKAEAAWCGVTGEVNHGWTDLSGVVGGQKDDVALWAGRNHPQKGLLAARMWARRTGVPLVELSDVPRAQVLAAMATARWFVFLPQRLDACPRTLIEAEASGCEIVTNENAGRRRAGPLEQVMAEERDRFWAWV